MQVGAVEVLQNFVAQQVEVIPENRITRRLTELEGDENVAEDHSSHIRSQRRSRSELQLRGVEGGSRRRIVIGAIRRGSSTAVRSGVRRRSTLRVRVRSLSPGSSVVQTATASRRRIVDEGHDGESRYCCLLYTIFGYQ